MAKKRKLKYKFKKFFRRLLLIIFLIIILFYVFKYIIFKKNYIDSVEYKDGKINVLLRYDDLYCILSDTYPTLNDKWVKAENKICTLKYNNKKLYIKNEGKIVYDSSSNIYFELSENEEIYLAVNDTYNIFTYLIGNIKKLKFEYNKDLIQINDNGQIKTLKEGSTTLSIKYKNQIKKYDITISSLIVSRPISFNYKKPYISCNKYSKEENDLLDEILKIKIENVKYKTRASVVEAARFLVFDFPYRINYFYENGRQTTNNIDGEGRYYHVGLYLDESRYFNLTGSTNSVSMGTWGCSIYSTPAKRNMDNGLDCSGFVSWALLNGGFDVKDVGAGWSNKEDLTDYGEVKKLSKTNTYIDKIKVGDLIHSEKAGGHIGIIVGLDSKYYYIAQALWYDEVGVIVTKIEKENLYTEFPHVVLMDKYYKEDGNLTNMWY